MLMSTGCVEGILVGRKMGDMFCAILEKRSMAMRFVGCE